MLSATVRVTPNVAVNGVAGNRCSRACSSVSISTGARRVMRCGLALISLGEPRAGRLQLGEARLVAIARDRSPDADIRVGDMHTLPWEPESFDVVTSFRGVWGTTPAVVTEIHRVLAPGGRLGLTVWGHIKASPGAWALSPFRLADPPAVANQAAMVALGRPGAGEKLLSAAGYVDIRRLDIRFIWEFADPQIFARALASTGPAYEAVRAVGEQAFHGAAVRIAAEQVRDGLPLHAEIAVTGYLAQKPRR